MACLTRASCPAAFMSLSHAHRGRLALCGGTWQPDRSSWRSQILLTLILPLSGSSGSLEDGDRKRVYLVSLLVYVLCNPWSPFDQCHFGSLSESYKRVVALFPGREK